MNNQPNDDFVLEIPSSSDVSIEGDKLVLAGEEYPLANVKAELEKRAKENATATVTLASGGTTVGAVTFGPPGALAGAVLGGSLGYLIDEGYITFRSKEDIEEVEIESVVEDMEPKADVEPSRVGPDELPDAFEKYEKHWYWPDSDIYVITVRTKDGGRAYFETIEGAKTRLLEEYER